MVQGARRTGGVDGRAADEGQPAESGTAVVGEGAEHRVEADHVTGRLAGQRAAGS